MIQAIQNLAFFITLITGFINLFVIGFAGYWVMLVWLNGGGLIARIRSYLEAYSDTQSAGFLDSILRKLCYMLTCKICLPIYLTVTLFLIQSYMPSGTTLINILAAAGFISFLYIGRPTPTVPPIIETTKDHWAAANAAVNTELKDHWAVFKTELTELEVIPEDTEPEKDTIHERQPDSTSNSTTANHHYPY